MKILLYLIYFFGFGLTAVAQDSTIALGRVHRAIIKFAPLSLLDPDATVQGAIEVWLKRRHSLQAEFGYGPNGLRRGGFGPSPWTPNSSLSGKEVWLARLEGRYYTSLFTKYSRSGTYVAIQGMYKQVNVAYLDTVLGGETIDKVFIYAPVTRYVFALHSKIGTQIPLGYNPKSIWSRLVIDFYVGPGIRHTSVVGRGAETVLLFQNNRIYERFQYSGYRPGDAFWRLSISAGLKIGVSL